ncbi:G patch domain-containing protein 11 [Mactra antiquata]
MSDEEDYMSDAFLKLIPDTRPGLLPRNAARQHDKQKKEKVANEKNKQKPRAVLEKEKREEGLEASISSENKGFALLQKMGYKPGMAIGKSGIGRTEPVPVELKTGRGGLGRDADQKRKKEEQAQFHKHMSAKRHKMDAENKQTFLKRMNEKLRNRDAEKDLYKSQKVCEQLDTQLGIVKPHELFFWPEALLPKEDDDDDDDELMSDQPLDRLQSGYSDYIQDDDDDDLSDDDDDKTTDDEKPGVSFSNKAQILYMVWN